MVQPFAVVFILLIPGLSLPPGGDPNVECEDEDDAEMCCPNVWEMKGPSGSLQYMLEYCDFTAPPADLG